MAFAGMELKLNFTRPRRSAPLSGRTSNLLSLPKLFDGWSLLMYVSSDGNSPFGVPVKHAGKPGVGVSEGVKVTVGVEVNVGVNVRVGVEVDVEVDV